MIKDKLYIIPKLEEIDKYMKLVEEYNLHFEYNDFFIPDVIDDNELVEEIIAEYHNISNLPENNTLHGAFLDVAIFSSDNKIRAISEYRIRQSIDVASKIGAKAMVMHTNFIPNFQDDNYENCWVERNAKFIKKLLRDYPDINVYMENMFDMTPDLLLRLAEKLKNYDNFGICLDYAHASVFGNGKLKASEWMEQLAPYIKHIHINDNDLIKDRHLPLGQGSIDYLEFAKLYEKYCNEATVLIEVSGIDKVRESLDYLKEKEII